MTSPSSTACSSRTRPGDGERHFEQVLAIPRSIRNAVGVIVNITVLAVVLGVIALWLLDSSEYPTYGKAVWTTSQTSTTVGYDGVTPAEPAGRIVAEIVMLSSIGLITVITAAVTSTFVAAAQRQGTLAHPEAERADLRPSLDDLARRLEHIERALDVHAERTVSRP